MALRRIRVRKRSWRRISAAICHFGSIVPSVQVADQGFFLAVAQPGHGQQCARVGGDGRAQVSIDRETQCNVVLGLDVLDPRSAGWHAVSGADQRVLHRGGQTGDGPAGNARGCEALAPVAGDLQDRPQPLRSCRGGHRMPGCPRSTIPRDNRRAIRAVTGIVLGRLVVPEVMANMSTSVPAPKRACGRPGAPCRCRAHGGRKSRSAPGGGNPPATGSGESGDRGRTGCRRAGRPDP